MNKKFIMLIFIIVTVMSLVSCGMAWQANDIYSTVESNGNNKVFLIISNKGHVKEDIPVTETYARLEISNESEVDIELNLDYEIKKEGKKGWIDLEKKANASEETIRLKAGESYEFSIDWSGIYGKLARPGDYMIIFTYSKPDGEHFASCHFGLYVP